MINQIKGCDNISIETVKNRDVFLKFCFMNFLIHILNVLGIDEEITEILSTEEITFEKLPKIKLFDNFLDFQVLTKSGKIMIFEFKKGPLRKSDLKQAYEYFDRIHCKKKSDVKLIIIVLSKKGKIKAYTHFDVTYHPQIIKTKTINKQKDLSIIRDKLSNNKKLTVLECSLLIALPLFELKESETEITEEICTYIRDKKHCIPYDILDEIVVAMYLNIVEYVDDDKQDELMEMIDMVETYEGLISQIRNEGRTKWRNEGRNEGIIEGKQEVINDLLENFPIDVVAVLLSKKKSEIEEILQK